MNLFLFKFKHFKDLVDLHKSQDFADLDLLSMKTLPKLGYIAYLDSQPIAVGFLRRVEPCYGQIDTMASNAYFGSLVRHEGIELVVNALLDEAKRLKLKGIICLTADKGIQTRAKEKGFHVVDQVVIAKAI